MRQTTVLAGVSGATEPVVLDKYIAPFMVSYSATGTGIVQVSMTDPFPVVNGNFVAPTFSWVTAPTAAPNGPDFLGQPYTAIRITAGVSGDALTVIQAGIK